METIYKRIMRVHFLVCCQAPKCRVCGRPRGHELKPDVRYRHCPQVQAGSDATTHCCDRDSDSNLHAMLQRATPTKVVERAKRTMAGIFDASATDGSKAHIRNVFGNMFESKKLRHMPPSTAQTAVRFYGPRILQINCSERLSNICIVTVSG